MSLGMGVMLNMLFGDGGETSKALEATVGKTISKASLTDDVLRLEMENGKTLLIRDNGQSCCETRYMTTDDDLSYYSGSTLLELSLEDGKVVDGEWGDTQEIQFLHVKTSKGSFTIETHNEHNGYYGGFYIVASLEE